MLLLPTGFSTAFSAGLSTGFSDDFTATDFVSCFSGFVVPTGELLLDSGDEYTGLALPHMDGGERGEAEEDKRI